MATLLEFNDTCSKCPPGSNVEDNGSQTQGAPKETRATAPLDHSQSLRHIFQYAFLLLNVWIGAAFYAWVRAFETGTHNPSMRRPAGVEGWLPIAGLMNFRY